MRSLYMPYVGDFARCYKRGTASNRFGGFTRFVIARRFTVKVDNVPIQEDSLEVKWEIDAPPDGTEWGVTVPILEFGIREVPQRGFPRVLFLRLPAGAWNTMQLPIGAHAHPLMEELVEFFKWLDVERVDERVPGSQRWQTSHPPHLAMRGNSELIAITPIHRSTARQIMHLDPATELELTSCTLIVHPPGKKPLIDARRILDFVRKY